MNFCWDQTDKVKEEKHQNDVPNTAQSQEQN